MGANSGTNYINCAETVGPMDTAVPLVTTGPASIMSVQGIPIRLQAQGAPSAVLLIKTATHAMPTSALLVSQVIPSWPAKDTARNSHLSLLFRSPRSSL